MRSDKVVEVFTEHYELAKKRMLPEAAISTAAAAAQNFVASTRERVRQGQEDSRRATTIEAHPKGKPEQAVQIADHGGGGDM